MTNQPLLKLPAFWLGLLLTLFITLISLYCSELTVFKQWGLSALTLAILFGMLIGNSGYLRYATHCSAGVQFAKQKLLRLGIILYGLHLTFQQIAHVGFSALLIDLLTLTSTFLLTLYLGRRYFQLDDQTLYLIGAGSSICGAAAVLAAEPITQANSEKVAVAVATVVIFGSCAMFVYPAIYQWLHPWFSQLSEDHFGIYIGSTVHEVAQVVVAGQAISQTTENSAVITKMIRVMYLAPFLLLLSSYLRYKMTHPTTSSTQSTGKKTIVFPWFALLFIVVALLNSIISLPAHWLHIALQVDTLLLAMAMAALGLTTHIQAIKAAGIKPLLLALTLFIWLIIGGGLINYLVQSLLAY